MRQIRLQRLLSPLTMMGWLSWTLGSCQNFEQKLYVAHDTKLGIDASYNAAMTAGSIDLGYDRRFVTWVPRSVEIDDDDPDAKEVMSVIACSRLQVGALSILYYDESMATGRAAKLFAQRMREEDGIIANDYFECFWKRDDGGQGG